MTSDENFQIIKRIEIETEKRKYTKNEKENIQKNTVAKARKIKATMKTKAQRNGVKNPTLNCQLCHLKPLPAYCQIG